MALYLRQLAGMYRVQRVDDCGHGQVGGGFGGGFGLPVSDIAPEGAHGELAEEQCHGRARIKEREIVRQTSEYGPGGKSGPQFGFVLYFLRSRDVQEARERQ